MTQGSGMSALMTALNSEGLEKAVVWASTYLPWFLSAITIYMTVLAGNKSRHAWLIGLGNQALWLVFILATGTWGLLPMNLALWVVYGRNHMKWNRA